MKWKASCLLLAFTALLGATHALAEEEIIGTVTSRSGSRLTIELPYGDTRELRVTEETRFFRDGSPVPVRRILPHTLVRVAPHYDTAQTITILEAPK